jgi:hypothetical protein
VCNRPGFDERTAAVMIVALSLGLLPLLVGQPVAALPCATLDA